MLGLFESMQEGAWSPSNAPRRSSWTFEYNADAPCAENFL